MPFPFTVTILDPVFLNDVARGIMFSFDFMYRYDVSQNEAGFFKRGLIVTKFKKLNGQVIYIDKQQIDLSKYPSDKLRIDIIENMNTAENTMQVESFLESYNYAGFAKGSEAGSIISNTDSRSSKLRGEQILGTPEPTTPTPTPEPIPEPEPTSIIISAEVQAILTKFDNNDYTYPSWLNETITWVKNGRITSNEFLDIFNYNLENGSIIDKTLVITPIPEEKYNIDIWHINVEGGIYYEIVYLVTEKEEKQYRSQYFVTKSGWNDATRPKDQEIYDYYNFDPSTLVAKNSIKQTAKFILKNGYVTGDIYYKAQPNFNSYYYNKKIISLVQIEDQSGIVIPIGDKPKSGQKINDLTFTLSEKDESININEYVGDYSAVKIKYFVLDSIMSGVAFSSIGDEKIVAQEIDLGDCPIGQHRDWTGKCVKDGQEEVTTSLLGKVMGVTALLGTLALLGSKRR